MTFFPKGQDALTPLKMHECGYMYTRLYHEDEELFNVVKQAIGGGATPWDVRNLVQTMTGDFQRAARCHAAATWMFATESTGGDWAPSGQPRRQRRRRRGR